jgi:hypothetical protein
VTLGRAIGVVVIAAACSGKPRPEDATHSAAARGDAASSDAGGDAVIDATTAAAGGRASAAGSGAVGSAARGATGDLQIRVQWPDVPVTARSSPGRTPCRTPRAPSVAPTTTWGIPDALVLVEGAPPSGPPRIAQVTLADCALTPRLVVGASLAVTSAVDRPAKLVLRKRGSVDDLGHLVAGDPIPVQLPIAGHTVTVALDAGAVYSLETDARDPEVAIIVGISDSKDVRVSDASGHAHARALAPGRHAITAWLPPRAGQPSHLGRGAAQIAAGELTEVTVDLTP